MKIASIEAIFLRMPFTVGGVAAGAWADTLGIVGIPAVKAAIDQMS
ncbi:hypothetical protein [Cupriavidus necator]|nr:hypothetical protein [Cupriavidus necator]